METQPKVRLSKEEKMYYNKGKIVMFLFSYSASSNFVMNFQDI